MRKIKMLLGFTICFTAVIFIHLSSQVIYFEYWKNIYEIISIGSFFGDLNWLVQSSINFIALIGSTYICLALFKILKKGYFNLKVSLYFQIAGLLLCLVAVLDFVRIILEMSISNQENYHFGNLTANSLLFLVGFGVLVLSQIIKNGTSLKQENDLTI